MGGIASSVCLLVSISGATKFHTQDNDTTRCLWRQVMDNSGTEATIGNWCIKTKDKGLDDAGNIP